MKGLKASNMRDNTVLELEELLKQERAELYRARRDLVLRQLTDVSVIKTRRHNIARLLTLITEKKRGTNV